MNRRIFSFVVLVTLFTLVISGCGNNQGKKHAEFLNEYMANVQAAIPKGRVDKNSDSYKKLVENKNDSFLREFIGHGGIVSYDIPEEIKVEDQTKTSASSTTMVTVLFNDKTTDDFLITIRERDGKLRVGDVIGMNVTRAFINGELERTSK